LGWTEKIEMDLSVVWLFLLVLWWGALHSFLASLMVKQAVSRLLGEKATRFYRLGYNVFAGLTFLPVLALLFSLPDRVLYRVPLPWAALMGLGMFLACVILVVGVLQTDVWEFLGLRQVFKPSHPDAPPASLVTDGLYRYVRHPLYTAGLAFLWLMPVMTANLLAVNLSLTIYIFIGAIFEERKLHREFGEAYASYAAQTPMFLPFFGRNKMPKKSSGKR